MRSTVLKLAALGAVVAIVGAAAVPAAARSTSDARPTLDGIPAVFVGPAELRADADDSGRVIAELRIGDRRVRGTFAAEELTSWTAAADSVVASDDVEARTPVLRAMDGEHFVLRASDARGARELTLYAATDDSLFMLHAPVADRETAPAIGTLRHAARVAKAVRFVTGR